MNGPSCLGYRQDGNGLSLKTRWGHPRRVFPSRDPQTDTPHQQILGYDGEGFVAFGELEFTTSTTEAKVILRLTREDGAVLEEIPWELASLRL